MRPMRELDLVIFDMDGTLVDSSAAVAVAYAAVISAAGGPSVSRDQIVAQYHLGPPPNIIAHFLGMPAVPAQVAGYHAVFVRAAHDLARIYVGIEAMLASMRQAGLLLAVFTGADTISAHTLLGAVGLLDRFDAVLGSDDVAVKPAPDGPLEVARRLGVAPARSAYVGDSPLDQRSARAADMLAVAAGWGHLFDSAEPADLRVYAPLELPSALGVDISVDGSRVAPTADSAAVAGAAPSAVRVVALGEE